jgi:tetratricopeptide (TPR) repeat protein
MTSSRRAVRVLTCSVVLLSTSLPHAQDHQHAAGEQLGTVHFETSCAAPAREPFDRAVALLHSFEFGTAIDGFSSVLAADPSCAMAYWGIAMARWTNPTTATPRPPAQIQQGLDAIAHARAASPKTAREHAYIEAVAVLFTDAETVSQPARIAAYERAMGTVAAAYPDDREASIFWALALTASAPPTDKTYANQLKAGAILERLLPDEPDHPGIMHYLIHTYDVPALAGRALDAARRYATIAPSAPHALHMPSHIFTRVGAWQDSIDTNIASAAAARRGGMAPEELHAMDYMVYAYLQTGQDEAVRALLPRLDALATQVDPTKITGAASGPAGAFALAAIPARWALERRDWPAAARLKPQPSSFPYTEAMTYFARALGASHTGALDDARRASAALDDIQKTLAGSSEPYWAEQVAIERDGAMAYLALAEGRTAEALTMMRAAAQREDATEKNAVTPGPLAPARELLGDMLLDAKQPSAALVEYEATLKKEPDRFHAVHGAARAAAESGDQEAARRYYAQLLQIAAHADRPVRPELAEAMRVTDERR